MARQTYTITAQTKTEDGTEDTITMTFEYPEGRAIALLGLLDNLVEQMDEVKRDVFVNNLDDASIIALVSQFSEEDLGD